MSEQLTVKEYEERIVRPLIVSRIRAGSMDAALGNPDCITIISRDPEAMKAAEDRLIELARLDRE